MQEAKVVKRPKLAIKKDLAPQSQGTKPNSSTTDNISQEKPKRKAKPKLSMDSKPRTLSLKFYDEQLPKGFEALKNAITTYNQEVEIYAIKHDKDEVADGVWKSTLEKPHYHVIARFNGSTKGTRIKTLLNNLGVVFRQEDETLLEHGAMETCENYINMLVYLTHDTPQAINDGKHQYDVSELITNQKKEVYEELTKSYVAKSHGQVIEETMEALDREAFERGYALLDFDDWWHEQPFAVRKDSSKSVIKESYQHGIDKRLSSTDGVKVDRVCIFLYGKPDTGKTYGFNQALIEKKTLNVSYGRSGKFDKLKCSTEAIIIDDDEAPKELLKLADENINTLYKRNRDNPPWCGDTLVCLSNLPFVEWIKSLDMSKSQMEAIISRFYIFELASDVRSNVADNKTIIRNGEVVEDSIIYPLDIVIHHCCERGLKSAIEKKDDLVLKYIKVVHKSILEYKKGKNDESND